MSQFWIMALLVTLPGLLILVPPLLRPRQRRESDLNQRNVGIARERLAELQQELAAGGLSQSDFEQSKLELEANLMDDLRQEETGVDATPARGTLMALLLLVPALAFLLYLSVGTPQILERLASNDLSQGQHSGAAQPDMAELLAKLEQKLKEDPNNAEGWFILGRSYMVQQRYADAVRALERAHGLIGDHPNVLTSLADAIAMASDGKVSGRAERLLQTALEKDANNVSALWLMGLAMQEQSRFQEAIGYWQRMMPLIQDDAEALAQLGEMIDKVKAQAGPVVEGPTPEPAQAAVPLAIRVSVRLSPALQDKVTAQDRLFVMAKAVAGPPMPLAAVRRTAAELPLEVRLDDSLAMLPSQRLSTQAKVLVQARIAKGSGGPGANPGDLESEAVEIEVADGRHVELEINRIVPEQK